MQDVAILVGVIVPLMTIAGSSVAFVWNAIQQRRENRRREFFDLMDRLDADSTLANKIAAIYQLRSFPEHKGFIVRFCDNLTQTVNSNSPHVVEAMRNEFNATRNYYETLERGLTRP